MKNLVLSTLCMLLTISCSQKSKDYVINGTLEDSIFNGQTVYLLDYNITSPIDSAIIENEKFTFTGKIETPKIFRLDCKKLYANLLMEQGSNIDVVLSRESVMTDNGGIMDKKNVCDDEKNIIYQAFLYEKKRLSDSGISGDEINKLLDAKRKEHDAKAIEQMIANKDNILGAHIFWDLSSSIKTLAEYDSLLNLVPLANQLVPVMKTRDNLIKREQTAEGKIFVDFSGKDINGEETSLSSFVGKGKYVLADFWASWCGPCKREIPNLKELHQEFGGDNFIVLGINVWDSKAAFDKAIEEEAMTWSHIYASDNNTATELYGIDGIPQIILFAPDGTIFKRNLRGETMKEAVKEALKK